MLIAQISDLHLRSDGSLLRGHIDTRAAIERCVAHVRRLDPLPDVVLATGDLADRGLPEDYPLLRRMLDGLGLPVYLIPGNHDTREPLHAAFADLGYLPSESRFIQYVVEDYPLRLIALDTLLPGEIGGGLCPARVDWLGARLAEAPDRPTLIFMHHPPFASGINFLDRPPFAYAEAMATLIAGFPNVRQIVCGHIHRAINLGWAGTCAAIAPSVVYQMNLALRPGSGFEPTRDPPAIALYHFREDGSGPVGYVSIIEGEEDAPAG